MNRLTLFVLILFPFVFSSCGKKIEGTIFDNFGKPIEDVEVTIENTQYKAQTNSNGKYAIDYAAGEIIMNFQKDGYSRSGEVLYITEKQTYPLKDITLIRVPEQAGIYIASNEFVDYVKLNRSNKTRIEQINGWKYEFYLKDRDSINIINVSSLDNIVVYQYFQKKHQLGIVGDDNKIANAIWNIFYKATVNQPIKGVGINYSENMFKHVFTPQYDVDYIYIFEDGFKNIKNPNTSYCLFRFEKKQP